MNESLQYLLLMGACLSLIGLGLSGVLVSRTQNANERRSKRLAAILTPHLRTTQIELSAFTLPEETGPSSAAGTSSTIFGFTLDSQALYREKW